MRRGIRPAAWVLAAQCALAATQPVAPADAAGAERVSLGATVSVPGADTPVCGARAACVLSVQPGGAAERAGLRPGDVILRVGTTAIAAVLDIGNALATAKVGDRLIAVVDCDRQPTELEVEFTAADVRRLPASPPVVLPPQPRPQ